MESLLNKESVKRVSSFFKEFAPEIKILTLKNTARTAQDAATLLECELGAIVKSLLFRAEDSFLL